MESVPNLLEVKIDQYQTSLVLFFAESNRLDLIKLFIEKFRVQNSGRPAKEVQQLLESWINQKNCRGYSCLFYAILNRNMEMILFLEALGGDIRLRNLNGSSLLHNAVECRNMEALIYYSKSLDLNLKNHFRQTPLQCAVHIQNQEAAFFLIKIGANLNSQDEDGNSALHTAVKNQEVQVVMRLLY